MWEPQLMIGCMVSCVTSCSQVSCHMTSSIVIFTARLQRLRFLHDRNPISWSLPSRRQSDHEQRDQQPRPVALQAAGSGPRGGDVPDGSAAPRHPGGRPPAAYHADEVCWRLRLQGGVRGENVNVHHKHTNLNLHQGGGDGLLLCNNHSKDLSKYLPPSADRKWRIYFTSADRK